MRGHSRGRRRHTSVGARPRQLVRCATACRRSSGISALTIARTGKPSSVTHHGGCVTKATTWSAHSGRSGLSSRSSPAVARRSRCAPRRAGPGDQPRAPIADAFSAGVVAAVRPSAPRPAPFVREAARGSVARVGTRRARSRPPWTIGRAGLAPAAHRAVARAREADDRAGAVEWPSAGRRARDPLGDTLRSVSQAALSARPAADQLAALDRARIRSPQPPPV